MLLAGCVHLPTSMSAESRFNPQRVTAIDHAIDAAIAARKLPGAVYHLERGAATYERGYGRLSYEEDAAAVTPATVKVGFCAVALDSVTAGPAVCVH